MKRKRDRSESGQLRNKINRWVRFLSKERDWDYVFMLEMEYMKLRQIPLCVAACFIYGAG